MYAQKRGGVVQLRVLAHSGVGSGGWSGEWRVEWGVEGGVGGWLQSAVSVCMP